MTYSTPDLTFECPCNTSQVVIQVPTSTYSPDPFLDGEEGVAGFVTRLPPSVSWDFANYSSWCVLMCLYMCVLWQSHGVLQ